MKKLEKTLGKKGFEPTNYGYPSRDKTIEEHGADLAIELRAHADAHPDQTIHFVTHSMGGIVLRAALNHPACPIEAKRGKAVLLSPPNRGSIFGRTVGQIDAIRTFLGQDAGKQLLTLENFDHLGCFPETVDVLVISGTGGWNPAIEGENDVIVSFEEGCLSTPHKHMRVDCLHSFMMFNRDVIYNTTLFLKGTHPQK